MREKSSDENLNSYVKYSYNRNRRAYIRAMFLFIGQHVSLYTDWNFHFCVLPCFIVAKRSPTLRLTTKLWCMAQNELMLRQIILILISLQPHLSFRELTVNEKKRFLQHPAHDETKVIEVNKIIHQQVSFTYDFSFPEASSQENENFNSLTAVGGTFQTTFRMTIMSSLLAEGLHSAPKFLFYLGRI